MNQTNAAAMNSVENCSKVFDALLGLQQSGLSCWVDLVSLHTLPAGLEGDQGVVGGTRGNEAGQGGRGGHFSLSQMGDCVNYQWAGLRWKRNLTLTLNCLRTNN